MGGQQSSLLPSEYPNLGSPSRLLAAVRGLGSPSPEPPGELGGSRSGGGDRADAPRSHHGSDGAHRLQREVRRLSFSDAPASSSQASVVGFTGEDTLPGDCRGTCTRDPGSGGGAATGAQHRHEAASGAELPAGSAPDSSDADLDRPTLAADQPDGCLGAERRPEGPYPPSLAEASFCSAACAAPSIDLTQEDAPCEGGAPRAPSAGDGAEEAPGARACQAAGADSEVEELAPETPREGDGACPAEQSGDGCSGAGEHGAGQAAGEGAEAGAASGGSEASASCNDAAAESTGADPTGNPTGRRAPAGAGGSSRGVGRVAGAGGGGKGKSARSAEKISTGLRGAAARVRRGVVVRLYGLEARTELNGARGLCLCPSSEGRWAVHLDDDPAGLFRIFRKENLQVVACGGALKSQTAAAAAAAATSSATPCRKRPREAIAPPSRDAVVQGIAELECDPLRHCPEEERPGLRRRLLLKWHPDKAPCGGNRELATKVTQAMMSLPFW